MIVMSSDREIVKFDISKEWFHYLTNAKYE